MGDALINLPITTEINSSTYTEIKLGTQDAYGYFLMISTGYDSTGFYIATDSSGTGETLVPSGLPGIPFSDFAEFNSTVMYCKAVSGTPSIVLFPGKLPSRG